MRYTARAVILDPVPLVPPPSNPANEGVARLCGDAAPMLLTFATLGVSIAMGTAVALVIRVP